MNPFVACRDTDPDLAWCKNPPKVRKSCDTPAGGLFKASRPGDDTLLQSSNLNCGGIGTSPDQLNDYVRSLSPLGRFGALSGTVVRCIRALCTGVIRLAVRAPGLAAMTYSHCVQKVLHVLRSRENETFKAGKKHCRRTIPANYT